MYSGGGPEYVHADIHDIDFKPGSSDELVITSDGGVFYTNGGSEIYPPFQEKNLSYGTLQFYTCDIYPVSGVNKYVGGLQDNGTLYYTGSALTINNMIDGGDGAYCFIDENNPEIMITSVYYNSYSIFYYEEYYNYAGDWSSGIFINPADYDNDDNVLYANACSFSGGNVNKILRINGIPNNPNGTFVNVATGTNVWFSSVTYSPHSPAGTANLFIGTLTGRVYKITNAQQNNPVTTEITDTEFPEANVSNIAIGGSDDTLLVTFSNYGVSSIWQTYDGGQTWEEKEGNLPDMPIRWALYYPTSARYAMIATETGIWTTENLDEADVVWTPDNGGLANVRVDMLQLRKSDNTVLAATHGRGLATATWDITTGISDQKGSFTARVYPNPSDGIFMIDTKDWGDDFSIEVFNLNGERVYWLNEKGKESSVLNLSGQQSGSYMLRVKSGDNNFTERIVIIR
jgi:hypothetical protein